MPDPAGVNSQFTRSLYHALHLWPPTLTLNPEPFLSKVYHLSGRGLRIITGRNEDDNGADSNGTGKTSLVAAPLWCLTGDMLARTEVGVWEAGGGARGRGA